MAFKGVESQIRTYSIPLILGIIAALIFANISPSKYEYLFGTDPNESHFEILTIELFGYRITSLAFLINDCFMVFFFGFACKEIIESLLPPKGNMYPISRATAPIISCIFGIITPIIIYISLISIIFTAKSTNLSDNYSYSTLLNGWGVPIATDISLAWVVASFVFVNHNSSSSSNTNLTIHPCISYLLVLAIADDAIGLIIIAVFYTDPNFKVQPIWLLLIIATMLMAFVCRKYIKIHNWLFYVVVIGGISWIGFLQTRIHPALSLIPVMPFMLIVNADDKYDLSMLDDYAKYLEAFVQYGLFFFTLGNAGVTFSNIGWITGCVFCAVVFGKTIGICLSAYVLNKCFGVSLPKGMTIGQLPLLGFVGSMSLTVALFVANVAFTDNALRQEAKMGALGSATLVMISCILYRLLCVKKVAAVEESEEKEGDLELESLNKSGLDTIKAIETTE